MPRFIDTMELARTRRDQNARTSYLYRLPPDILAPILLQVQRARQDNHWSLESIDTMFEMRSRQTAPRWSFIVNTCSHLREVALGASELWQIIEMPGNANWHALCRERSQGLPPIVHVIYDSTHERVQDVRDAIAIDFPRALQVHLCERRWNDRWAQMHDPDPLYGLLLFSDTLEYLSISRPWRRDDMFLRNCWASTSLTTLVLGDIVGHIAWPTLPRLRRLMLRCWGEGSQEQCANVMMRWLNYTPSIEVLYLSTFCLFTQHNSDATQHVNQFKTPTHLPALQTLRISGTTFACQEILEYLTPHPKRVLDIEVINSWRMKSPECHPRFTLASEAIVRHVKEFWNHTRKSLSLPPLLTQAVIPPQHNDAHLVLGSAMAVTYDSLTRTKDPFCRLRAPLSSYMNSSVIPEITGIQLVGEGLWTVTRASKATDVHGIGQMAGLHGITIAALQSRKQIVELERWLKERKSVGRQVDQLHICSTSAPNIGRILEEVGTRLKQEAVLKEVDFI